MVEKSNNPDALKLHDLRCLDAVIRLGSFQAAAGALNRTHPSVFAAIARLEAQLSLTLLDRTGYRVVPTEAGIAFRERAAGLLADASQLAGFAGRLAGGDEPILRVVLGDLCPRPVILPLLSSFFATAPATRLHLDHEAVSGPGERLRDGTADLVLHRLHTAAVVERIELASIALLPVAAPGFLPDDLLANARPDRLRPFTQCVVRDTARGSSEDHLLIDGAHTCSVPDHDMKKALIVHGLAWGHLPEFVMREELADGRLVRIGGEQMPGRLETLTAMRRSDKIHGPVAERLWATLRQSLQLFTDHCPCD